MMAARPGRWIAFTAILAVVGCSEPDQVRVHDETPPPPPTTPKVSENQKQFRTLAAMVPADGGNSAPTWWFIKLSGSTAIVNKYEADVDKLFNSLSAKEDNKSPITELPTGWTQEDAPPGGMRVATLKAPGGEVEIAVTHFGGSVLANAARWWGELWSKEKGPEFTEEMLPEYVKQRNVKGRLILRVDMFGPNEPPKRPNPTMMPNPHGGKN
jgi:hypothetical protein